MTAHHELMGGKLHVYRRGASPYWQCSAFLNGRNYRISTKEDSLADAKRAAEEWYLELRGKHVRGEIKKVEKTFRDAAEQFQLEYPVVTQGQRSASHVAKLASIIRVHLLPFFGDLALSELTEGKVQEYRVHRAATSRTGKPPARGTMHGEIVVLRLILKTAKRHGWIKYLPDLSVPYRTAGKITHRGWFSPEEYKKLYEATRKHAALPTSERTAWARAQLHDYVLFMANTGLRTDEAARLEFRDVEIEKDDDTGETILVISVRGKRGVGYCKSTTGAVLPFKRLRDRPRPVRSSSTGKTEWQKSNATDRLFPCKQGILFRRILIKERLEFDREGNPRSPYSLRHTYICLRLMEGADIYAIAKNCRTSVEMIEKFYAAHIKTTLDAAAINVRRPRKHGKPNAEAAGEPD